MPITFEIFPSIGIARVGNSPDHFIFSGSLSNNLKRRDTAGAVLRQAAEFRIYKCDRDAMGILDSAVELTKDSAAIEWIVHVANRKAVGNRLQGTGRRNSSSGNDTQDAAFIIDSGVQKISTPGQSKKLTGAFMGNGVDLGEMIQTPTGRLLFLGGDGTASSPTNRPITNFADNDGWFDTTSDGPVRAIITVPGQVPVEAIPAWVVTAPPDFAPPITNLVTMFDVLMDLGVTRKILSPPTPVVFSRHIQPILERALNYQWVNSAARLGYADSLSGAHSSGGPGDFSLKMAILGDPAQPNQPRARIFRLLRDPNAAPATAPSANMNGMPRINDEADRGDILPLTTTQYGCMLLWSQGKFVSVDPGPVAESEPEELTRAALESCSGGPFFPGIEAGRIMRDASRYMPGQAFRLSHAHVMPGEITQNNAVPWQADFTLCRWEETDGAGNLKRLAWWPAQRPDNVLTNSGASPTPWARGIADTFLGMVSEWHRLGFVMEDPANRGMFIEQERDPNLPP